MSFRPVADAEFIESAAWYEDQREGLGLKFIDHVQHALDNIAENPLRFPVVFNDIREGLLSEFPYAIYYRIKSNHVVILSVFHCSRNPAIWQSRT